MSTKYNLRLVISLDDKAKARLLRLARSTYNKSGPSRAFRDKRLKEPIPADEFLPNVEHALIELAEANDFFRGLGIRIERSACGRISRPWRAGCDRDGPRKREGLVFMR